MAYKPMQTGYSRVFLLEGRAKPSTIPSYQSQLKMTGLSQAFGDVTKIEIPDPDNYDGYLEVDSIRGTTERMTTSLVGRYAAAIRSTLLRIAREGCSCDVQLHIGECTDPSAFNTFTKSVILEDVIITNWGTEDLGALGSDERAKADETADISVREAYEVVPLTFGLKGGAIITKEVVDIVIYDTKSCGSCGTYSDGCQQIYSVGKSAGGSPSTPSDVVYSLDGGVNWLAHDVDTLSTEEPKGIAGVGDYIVVVSAGAAAYGLHYALISQFEAGTDPSFTRVATGIVATGKPNAIFSLGRKAFIVGDLGYVYYTEDPTSGVTVLDAGSATSTNLLDVYAYDEDHAIAVGNSGVVIHTVDKTTWASAAAWPTHAGINLTSCCMRSQTEWWVTTSAGTLYYTTNSGASWTQKVLPGTTPTSLKDVKFSTASVGYVTGVVSSHGRIWRTIDGGYSWFVLPESGTMPATDAFNALAPCKYDANFVVAGGLADDGSDGAIALGSAS